MLDAIDGPAAPAALRRVRATAKLLPEHARVHNRTVVLQQLFTAGPLSRAELARATRLTRVTVSELVAELLADGYVTELVERPKGNVGKPATLLEIDAAAHCIVVIDLSDDDLIRGAVASLTGELTGHRTAPTERATGEAMLERLLDFCAELLADAPAPVLGVGIGSPGIIDADGRVVQADNRGWFDVPLARILSDRLGVPAHVRNDADAAMLGEYAFGEADEQGALTITFGSGVGSGIMLDGALVRGAGRASGEIGHVRVVDDGAQCACGRHGCLETLLSVPALRRRVQGLAPEAAAAELAAAGRTLGLVLAPIVSGLNVVDVVMSGPAELLDGPLVAAVLETLGDRTLTGRFGDPTVRMTALGGDAVLAGAVVLVLSEELGVL